MRRHAVEIIAKLKFTTPCLGNVRRDDFDRMVRDDGGHVIFLPSWWRAAFAQAASAISRYYNYVDQIRAAPPVEGDVTKIERRYGNGENDVKVHEGFDAGATIIVKFAIPGKMHVRQFVELLEAIGDYIGISPYGWKRGKFGHFKVLEVNPRGGRYKKGGRRSTDRPAVRRNLAAGAEMHPPTTGGRER
jgi:hypothetical protein